MIEVDDFVKIKTQPSYDFAGDDWLVGKFGHVSRLCENTDSILIEIHSNDRIDALYTKLYKIPLSCVEKLTDEKFLIAANHRKKLRKEIEISKLKFSEFCESKLQNALQIIMKSYNLKREDVGHIFEIYNQLQTEIKNYKENS